MREFIFRAYKHGTMDYSVDIPYSEYIDLNEQIDGLIDRDYKVMQYIGFCDTKNTRIYEGDIVSINNLMYDRPVITDVFFDKGSFRYRHVGTSGSMIDTRYIIEVIGNIYENPELLKDE